MKTAAMLLVYFGYGLICFGVDHLANGCTPFSCVMLGRFAGSKCPSGSVPCPKGNAGGAPPAKPATPGNTPYNVTQAAKGNPNYIRDYLHGTGPYKGEPLGPSTFGL